MLHSVRVSVREQGARLPPPLTPQLHLGRPPTSPEAGSRPTFHGDRGHAPPGEVAPGSFTARPWQSSALQPSRPPPHSAAAGLPRASHPGWEAPLPLPPLPLAALAAAPTSLSNLRPALGRAPGPPGLPRYPCGSPFQPNLHPGEIQRTAAFPGGPCFTLGVYGRRYFLNLLLERRPSVGQKVGEQ